MIKTSNLDPGQRWATWLIASAIVLGVVSPMMGEGVDDPVAWAPDNTILYAGVDSGAKLAEAFKKTAAYRSMKDPRLEDVFKPFVGVQKKLLEGINTETGLQLTVEGLAFPTGPIAVFLTGAPPSDSAEGEPDINVVVATDWAEGIAGVRDGLTKLTEYAVRNGAKKKTNEVMAVEIVTLDFPEPEEGSPLLERWFELFTEAIVELGPEFGAMPLDQMIAPVDIRTVSYCVDGSRLVVGSDTEIVERTLRNLRGRGEKHLAATPPGKLLRRECPAESHIRVMFNVERLIDLIRRTDEEAGAVLKAWGLDGLGPVVLGVEMAPKPGMDSRASGFWKVADSMAGVPRMLRMQNRPITPPSTVSRSAVSFGALQLNVRNFFSEFMDSMARQDPDEAAAMRASMKQTDAQGEEFDIEAQVINNLAEPVSFQVVMSKPYDAENIGFQFGVGHRDRRAIEKLYTMEPGASMFQKRDLLGSSIYEISAMPGLQVTFAVTESAWMVGTTSQLERFIRAEGKTGQGLSESPAFERLSREVPEDAWGTFYFDSAMLYDAQLAIHKAGDATQEPMPFQDSVSKMMRYGLLQLFEGQELKDPEALRDYQGAMLMTVRTESEGLRMNVVQVITPPVR